MRNEQKHELKHIVPFNDYFFHSCFYTMLFTALQSMGRSTIPFFVNALTYYSFYQHKNRFGLYIDLENTVPIESFIAQQNIEIHALKCCRDLKRKIVDAMSDGFCVLLSVDCFYEPFREEFYLKRHWPHTLLIFGFDLADDTFQIVEHDSVDSTFYFKRTIGIPDLVKAYQGYQSFFKKSGENTFLALRGNDKEAFSRLEWKKRYIQSQRENSPKIRLGNGQILLIKEALEARADHFKPNDKERCITDMLQGCNNILNFKHTQQQVLKELLGTPLSLAEPLLSDIYDLWKKIRISLSKHLYSKRVATKVFEPVCSALDSIYLHEDKLHEIIIGWCDDEKTS